MMKVAKSAHQFLVDRAKIVATVALVVVALLVIFGPILDILPGQPETVIIASVTIVTTIGAMCMDLLHDIRKRISSPNIVFYRDDASAQIEISKYIESVVPRKADLLEFSASIPYSNILVPLAKCGSQIRLLMQNPKTARERMKSNRQEQRICRQLASNLSLEPEITSCHAIRIRFYDEIASLRARKFDNNMLQVSWFTYDLRPEDMPIVCDPVQVWGHNNCCFCIKSSEKGFKFIEDLFDRVFNNLWNHAIRPVDVCGECNSKKEGSCGVNTDWLRRISEE